MAQKILAAALGMMVAASPVSAANQDADVQMSVVPPAGPGAKYCLYVELTGRIVEAVRCWTREEWAEQGVDLDKEWAREGVAIEEGGVRRPIKS